ncbi:penicillin acylase family protein [Rugosimonospora africana]|uniref:penicillin acylase family protein n=1 Tax=Rugosimonospora africana TaxID=556532 RepID=UPI001940463F|nr:penicillin acylase family protein [Rugosimonospora africana]
MRVVRWSLIVVLVLVVTATIGGVWTVRTSFPQYGGELRIAGLSAPVTVYHDAHAIPQVYASNATDLFIAQGYLHAQERFWEMDFRRHLTSGRLSEMFGSTEVETDAYLRTMGWRRVAEQEWNLISPQSREYLRDYADGVNAYLRTHRATSISLEYSVLKLSAPGYRIAPWDPIDSLAWLKALAWDLLGNMDDEIERASLLAAGLSRTQVEQLYPAYPYDQHSPIVTAPKAAKTTAAHTSAGAMPAAAAPALADVDRAMRSMPDLVDNAFPGIGSNSWVISGTHTATGKPILANDPHLEPSMPGIWYQMGLHCACQFNVEGFTFSGVPGVIIGHNSRIAWGFTNLDPDVSDLYLERVRGDQYEVDGRWRDLAIRKETIKVAGGKPVTLTIRTTGNGPLLSDASAELRAIGTKPDVDPSGSSAPTAAAPAADAGSAGYAVALRWTALDPGRTMDALFALDAAGNWDEFRAAAAQFEVPAQNIVYADTNGNIGYQSPGRIPVRGKGDGRWPAPGWDSAYDWTGYLPFDELPSELNPPEGFFATANQAVIDPANYPHFLTDDWSYGYRSQRIKDMISSTIASGAKVSVADVQRMQFDNRNGLAPALVPALLVVPQRGAAVKAQDLLRGWDFQEPADGDPDSATGRDSAAAAYFNVVWRQLLSKTFDELPADRKPDGSDRWWLVVTNLLSQPDSPWWDNRSTPAVETRDDILGQAMAAATAELTKKLGDDPADWRWGAIHTLYVQNQSFGTSGIGPIEWLFNYGPVGVSGGSNLVNATGWDPSAGYEVNAVPSMRMIVDLSNLDASRWVQLTGESGHAFSDHYHDQFDLWRTGKTLPMRWNEATIKSSSVDTLTLKP